MAQQKWQKFLEGLTRGLSQALPMYLAMMEQQKYDVEREEAEAEAANVAKQAEMEQQAKIEDLADMLVKLIGPGLSETGYGAGIEEKRAKAGGEPPAVSDPLTELMIQLMKERAGGELGAEQFIQGTGMLGDFGLELYAEPEPEVEEGFDASQWSTLMNLLSAGVPLEEAGRTLGEEYVSEVEAAGTIQPEPPEPDIRQFGPGGGTLLKDGELITIPPVEGAGEAELPFQREYKGTEPINVSPIMSSGVELFYWDHDYSPDAPLRMETIWGTPDLLTAIDELTVELSQYGVVGVLQMGTKGDAAHQARESAHNSGRAIDIAGLRFNDDTVMMVEDHQQWFQENIEPLLNRYFDGGLTTWRDNEAHRDHYDCRVAGGEATPETRDLEWEEIRSQSPEEFEALWAELGGYIGPKYRATETTAAAGPIVWDEPEPFTEEQFKDEIARVWNERKAAMPTASESQEFWSSLEPDLREIIHAIASGNYPAWYYELSPEAQDELFQEALGYKEFFSTAGTTE